MGHFVVKTKINLEEVSIGQKIEESDFSTLTPSGHFVQMEYISTQIQRNLQLEPGIWSIELKESGFEYGLTSFTNDEVLSSFVHTKNITEKIDKFFSKLSIYKELGIEVPRRGVLLFGPAGGGKSTAIGKIINERSKDKDTAIVYWNTSKFDSSDVKNLFKSTDFSKVEKFILIVEDIGGVEIDETTIPSDSSLLSILDNQEKIFTKPTMIIATTNFPEVFLGNLTNRPQRFDDKIEIGYPDPIARGELFKFLGKEYVSNEDVEVIRETKYNKFTPAHLREVVIRARLYDKTNIESMQELLSEIQQFEKQFQKRTEVGFAR